MTWSLAAKHRWRAALRIQHQLQVVQRKRHQLELPHDIWRNLVSKVSLHSQTVKSDWKHAHSEMKFDLSRRLTELKNRIEQLMSEVKKRDTPPMAASVIWGDLESLPDEFEEVECDLEDNEIRVTTDDIELEGVYLGRFQIVFDWMKLGQNPCYHIKALDPHPAESNEDTVHPHINNEHLCEGDGASSIKQALSQGRLFDFFLLVRQILTTYNSGSAYLALEKWHGTSCQSCSTVVASDNTVVCSCCRDLICLDCTGSCNNCTDSMCQSCVKACPQCDNYFCSRCMIHCSACMADGCDACLKDGLCSSCETSQENEDESTDEEDPDVEADTLCMGQTAVYA